MGTLIEISTSAVKMCRLYFPAYFNIDDISLLLLLALAN